VATGTHQKLAASHHIMHHGRKMTSYGILWHLRADLSVFRCKKAILERFIYPINFFFTPNLGAVHYDVKCRELNTIETPASGLWTVDCGDSPTLFD
jgi:hypothetical protein